MRRTFFTFILVIASLNSYAQENYYPYPSLSPKGNISQTVGNTLIEIEYERPSARKRQVFGELVTWNKVWRTGAGHSTKIRFDKDVIVGGQKINAGNYSLFTIPNPNEWIVIINKDTTLYGSYDYNYKNDIARFTVIPTESNRYYETLNFDIEILPNDAKIFISWANIQISFDVRTTTDSEIELFIRTELLTKKNKESDIYAGATEYLLYQGNNLSDALTLADIAIDLDKNNGWARDLKIRIFERLKRWEDAIEEINRTIQNIQLKNYNIEKDREIELKRLKLNYERIVKLKN